MISTNSMRMNIYSSTWFETFLLDATPDSTGVEIEFLTWNLPLPEYRSVLDLCCGAGRHSLALANLGYSVTGLDINPYALEAARKRDIAGKVTFVEGDMRHLSDLHGPYDAVINLWQSLGYFSAKDNKDVVKQVYNKLRPGGRFVLDIYNRDFFEAHQGTRTIEMGSRMVVETKHMASDRLTVHLDYGPSVQPDTFEWQLYTPDDICAVSEEIGFHTVVTCSGFDESISPSPANPRMQLVFDKV